MGADSLPDEVAPGTVLAGKYQVERVLGRGGMGIVVEARHTALDQRVALKFLLPEVTSHPEARERFVREAKAAVRIKSAHVARVSDVGVLESGSPYMVMEYLEGLDSARLLEANGALAVPEAIDLIVQACDAISEAHAQGIVHRDLKPANLFVARHPDGTPFVKVLDFGISKLVDHAPADALTRTNATLGSGLYMSPEQIRQPKSVDRRTDVYALGVTLYELLTGQVPFWAETFASLCVEIVTGSPRPLRQWRSDLPEGLVAVVERAIASDLAARYQSVAELTVALAPWAPMRSQPIIERVARAAGVLPGGARGASAGPAPASAPRAAEAIGDTHLDAATTLGHRSSGSRSRLLAGAAVTAALVAGALFLYAQRARPPGSNALSRENEAKIAATAPSPPRAVVNEAVAPPKPLAAPPSASATEAASSAAPSASAAALDVANANKGGAGTAPRRPPKGPAVAPPRAPAAPEPVPRAPSAPTSTKGADEYR